MQQLTIYVVYIRQYAVLMGLLVGLMELSNPCKGILYAVGELTGRGDGRGGGGRTGGHTFRSNSGVVFIPLEGISGIAVLQRLVKTAMQLLGQRLRQHAAIHGGSDKDAAGLEMCGDLAEEMMRLLGGLEHIMHRELATGNVKLVRKG